MENGLKTRLQLAALVLATAAVMAACSDTTSSDVLVAKVKRDKPLGSLVCTASVATNQVSCGEPVGNLSPNIIGGQNVYTKVTTSNVSYNSGTSTFSFDLTVQNLLNETIGRPGDGAVVTGVNVFMHGQPTATSGSGIIEVMNEDGTATFTAPDQPYFHYDQVLTTDEVSAAKTWQLNIPSSVTTFTFFLLIDAHVTPKLVINEVMANSSGTTIESTGDWFELYNAGSLPINLEGLVIADSAASGRRPYHLISSSVEIQPGGYAVIGSTTNTTSNGGVPVDYAFGTDLALASSLDAVKISRVINETDTITIDRTQYASGATSAQDGVARELKNPALDNSNMDGSNWASALVTAVYGAGGRGTPKAQNSTYTP